MTTTELPSDNPYDADNLTGINQTGEAANTPVERLTVSSIIGDSIENARGEKLGSIDNLTINLNTGMVESAVAALVDSTGVEGKLLAIPFRALTVNPEKRVFILDRDREYLESLHPAS